MLKSLKTFAPLLLGLIPFLLSWFSDFFLLAYGNPITRSSLFFFAATLWYTLGFHSKKLTGKAWLAVLLLNIPSFIMLILVGVRELQGVSLPNAVAVWSSLFFIPMMSFGFWFTRLFGLITCVFPAYCVVFLLTLTLSILGTRHQEKTARGF